jgi:Holliday junction resolvase
LKPESKFWKEWKAFTPNILWTRIENMSSLGTPDLLGYNKNKTFFTVELKVTSGNSVRLSPHQMSFHIRHPENTFILVKSLASSISKLYEGKNIKELSSSWLAA